MLVGAFYDFDSILDASSATEVAFLIVDCPHCEYYIEGMNPLAVLREHLEELQKLGASRIGIFGSHATGKANSKSDVDIYVEFNDSKRTYDNFFALHELLEKLLQSRIDLVTDKSLTPSQARLILPTVRYVS